MYSGDIMSRGTMLNGRIIFDIIILAITGWAFSVTQTFPESFMQEHINSAFFPSIVCGLLMILMLNVLWTDFRELRENGETLEKLDMRAAIGAITILGLLILYVVLIEAIGFKFATMLFLFSAMMVCHATLSDEASILPSTRYIIISVVASIGITLLTHALFVHGFGLSLY